MRKPGTLEQPEDPSFRPTEFLILSCIPSVCTPKKPQNVKSSVFFYQVFP